MSSKKIPKNVIPKKSKQPVFLLDKIIGDAGLGSFLTALEWILPIDWMHFAALALCSGGRSALEPDVQAWESPRSEMHGDGIARGAEHLQAQRRVQGRVAQPAALCPQ